MEDLRLLIGQQIGLRWLSPVAVQALVDEPLAEGHMYVGDLPNAVIRTAPEEFRRGEPRLRKALLQALEPLDSQGVLEEDAQRIGQTALQRLRRVGPAH